ncbi:MAG: alpha-glucosidase [Promethearchaeota archaeon]
MLDKDLVPWWKKTTVYQIYPRSFADSNNDGIGDLEGIISKLDHVQELGVETIWFSPFYKSPQKDFGYDISDYRDISPEYGTMQTCDRLVREIHERGMKVVFDMVLNHTSDEHPWFIESRSSRDNPKRDWYIWRDGKKPGGKKPPNNWKSMLMGSGWHYDAVTDQWYWAQFLSCQPDLNYRNPEVRQEMLDTMRFWLKKGVDGFRLDIINAIFEDELFRDNPFSWRLLPGHDTTDMFFQEPKYTLNHPDTIEFMHELRALIDEFDDPPRFMVGEVSAPFNVLRRYMGNGSDGLHLTFQFQALGVPLRRKNVEQLINDFEKHFPEPYIPTWVFSNHDRMRRISRLDGDLTKGKLNVALQLTARGVPFIYYGEEIGMEQHELPLKTALDPVARRFSMIPGFLLKIVRRFFKESLNRDECRTPMQWDSTQNAGFCDEHVKPWLPVTKSYKERNVERELEDQNSLLNCYKRFLKIRRQHPALHCGNFEYLSIRSAPNSLLAYKREARTGDVVDRVFVFLNFSDKAIKFKRPLEVSRLLVSTDVESHPISNEAIVLGSWEGIVVEG